MAVPEGAAGMPGGIWRGRGQPKGLSPPPAKGQHGVPCPDSATTAVPRSGSWRMPLESRGWLERTGEQMAATRSPCNWGKRTGEGLLPDGDAREPSG